MDEAQLIEEAKSGNKSALNKLLSDNYGILTGYIMKMCGNEDLTKDISQETLLKAVINIDKFTPKAKFSTWLIKIATNVYRDYLRKRKFVEYIDETTEDSSPNVEEEVINKDEYKNVINILKSLSYEKRAVFILKHYYGYKYEEISNALGCPVGTVRSRLHNSIKYIIDEMERRKLI
ncbi:MAG: polymerase sigma factor SigY [Clostridiaceae bacterium]|jgi:RNA polymerase sigma-70 factor (ECF subfamily)|nr:polymerase sigma factor SigY [Clostridiaceae bacterium]